MENRERRIGLIIVFVIVLVANYFFDPLNAIYSFLGSSNPLEKIWVNYPFWIKGAVYVLTPVIFSVYELLQYIVLAISAGNILDQSAPITFGIILVIWIYIIVIHMLQVMENDTVEYGEHISAAINMLFLENIVMYVANVIGYVVFRLSVYFPMPREIFDVLTMVLGVLTAWVMICELTYVGIGAILTLLLPLLPAAIVAQWNEALGDVTLLIAMFIVSQVIWRMLSSHVYKFMVKICTFGRIKMS